MDNSLTSDRQKSFGSTLRASAFERIWPSHRMRIWRLVARLAGSADIADDLTQEVALRAFEGYRFFRSRSAIDTWLYRIAVNVVLRYRERKVIATDSLEQGSAVAVASNDPARRPEMSAMTGDLKRAVQAAIDGLPGDLRTIAARINRKYHVEINQERREQMLGAVCWIKRSFAYMNEVAPRYRTENRLQLLNVLAVYEKEAGNLPAMRQALREELAGYHRLYPKAPKWPGSSNTL